MMSVSFRLIWLSGSLIDTRRRESCSMRAMMPFAGSDGQGAHIGRHHCG